MSHKGHIYCISCQDTFDQDADEHARERHGSLHASLPEISHVRRGHYIASHDSVCTVRCNWGYLHDGITICHRCHALRVPHQVADPR
jgi:hypothetical protein